MPKRFRVEIMREPKEKLWILDSATGLRRVVPWLGSFDDTIKAARKEARELNAIDAAGRKEPKPKDERPSERSIQDNIVEALESLGWDVVKIHGGPYQEPGIFDLWCFRNGVTVWIEVKRPGEKMEPSQERIAARLDRQNIPHGVAESVEEALAIAENAERFMAELFRSAEQNA